MGWNVHILQCVHRLVTTDVHMWRNTTNSSVNSSDWKTEKAVLGEDACMI